MEEIIVAICLEPHSLGYCTNIVLKVFMQHCVVVICVWKMIWGLVVFFI